MKYQKYTYNGYNMYFIKSTHFKDVRVIISFRKPLKKSDITLSNMLSSMLVYETKKYPTQRLLSMEKQKLYNASIVGSTYRWGNYLFNELGLFILNDKYTEAGNLNNGIDLLLDVIYEPNVTKNKFDDDSFKIAYGKTKEDIDTIKENKARYAFIRMKQEMQKNAIFSYFMDGYQKDLDKITPFTLYNYYKRWLRNSTVDIFVAGDFDMEEVKNKLISRLPKREQKSSIDLIYQHQNYRKKIKKHFEVDDVKQSNLVFGFKLKNVTSYERQYVIPLYNIIFGSSSTSKLFTIVREKYSLCYNIYSSIVSASNIMTIEAGIDKNKFKKTVALIKKLMKEMEDGSIELEKFNNAKTKMIERMKTIDDSSSSLINECQVTELLGDDDLETSKVKIMNVTIKDIQEIAKKIVPDTIYLLHGGDTDENN